MVIRVSHIPEQFSNEASQPSTSPSDRVASGTLRYNGQGEVETVGVTRYQSHNVGAPGGSIAGTLNSTFGKPSVELSPGDPSSRTLVETAVREGLIRKDGDRYVDVLAADGKPTAVEELREAAPEAPADPGEADFDPHMDELFGQSIATMDQSVYDASAASIIGVVALGHGSLEDSAKSLASRANMDSARAQMMVQNGTHIVQTAADSAMARLGIEGERLERMYEAFRAQPRQLMPAVQRLALRRDPSALVEMAKVWRLTNP